MCEVLEEVCHGERLPTKLVLKMVMNQEPTSMNLDEAKAVCQERSKWASIVSAHPSGTQASLYVCIECDFQNNFDDTGHSRLPIT